MADSNDQILFRCESCGHTRSVPKTTFPLGKQRFNVTCPKCSNKSLLDLAVGQPQELRVPPVAEPELTESQIVRLYQQIAKMPVTEKTQLAMTGSREARDILIRDANKMVAVAVAKSPKIAEDEIENISKSRSVCEEVLRTIGSNANWMSSRQIKFNLASNPRTPLPMVLEILPELQKQDLEKIASDRKVAPQVAAQAQRLLGTRQ